MRGDPRQRAEDDVELGVDRLDGALERAQVLRLDALQRGTERREPLGDPDKAPAHDDQRDREHDHDDGDEHDGQKRQQVRVAHAAPYPSVSAFM